MRDAVGLLDQVWATHGDTISRDAVVDGLGLSSDARALELAKAALSKDLKAGLTVIADAQDDAVDFSRFNKQVVAHLRHALLRQSGADESLDLSEPEADGLAGLAAIGGPADTAAALRAFGSADLRTDAFSALPLELALAGLVYAPAPAPAPAPAAAPPARNGRRAAPARDGGGQRATGGGRPRPDEPAPTFRTPPPARPASPPPGAAPAPAPSVPPPLVSRPPRARPASGPPRSNCSRRSSPSSTRTARPRSTPPTCATPANCAATATHSASSSAPTSRASTRSSSTTGSPSSRPPPQLPPAATSRSPTAAAGADAPRPGAASWPPPRKPRASSGSAPARAERRRVPCSGGRRPGPDDCTGRLQTRGASRDPRCPTAVARTRRAMAKRGGMFRQPKKARGHGAAAGGGGVNPNMLRQAQALQAQFQEAQEELKQATVSASAGGGVISVEMGGDRKLLKVSIDPDALDPDDHELVEDLFMAAVNEATDKLEALQQERLGGLTGGLGLPGLG